MIVVLGTTPWSSRWGLRTGHRSGTSKVEPATGQKAVLTALAGNLVVAVGKGAGFAATGSGSLLSETIHSLADCSNQVGSTIQPLVEPYGGCMAVLTVSWCRVD
jgi:hypothetical protein